MALDDWLIEDNQAVMVAVIESVNDIADGGWDATLRMTQVLRGSPSERLDVDGRSICGIGPWSHDFYDRPPLVGAEVLVFLDTDAGQPFPQMIAYWGEPRAMNLLERMRAVDSQ